MTRSAFPYRRLGPHDDLDDAAPLVEERPLVIRVNGAMLATVMVTPTALAAFVAGFLYNEGVVDGLHDVVRLELCDDARVADVVITGTLDSDRVRLGKFVVSGCGADAPPDVWDRLPPLPDVRTDRDEIVAAMDEMYRRSERYRESGGVHSAALLGHDGAVDVAEDVGRHNAVDKLAGAALVAGRTPPGGRLVCSTGRISAEMVTKALRMGVPVAVSRTSPTDAAVRLAEREGVTVVGYCRRRTMRVYTRPDRIA